MSKCKSDNWYLERLLKRTTQDKIDGWLKNNPPPKNWQCGKYAWAYTEMIIF